MAVMHESLMDSQAIPPDMRPPTSISVHGMGLENEEAKTKAAFALHQSIVRNLTARLSLSARLLFGVVLTEPWDVVEAFRQ